MTCPRALLAGDTKTVGTAYVSSLFLLLVLMSFGICPIFSRLADPKAVDPLRMGWLSVTSHEFSEMHGQIPADQPVDSGATQPTLPQECPFLSFRSS